MAEERSPRMSSVLGETSVVVGNVDGSGDLEIRGRVQGSVTLKGRLLITESGVILGNVEAASVAVAGEVRGDLTAEDGVEVHAQGRVEGNIEAPRVGIEAGARVRGMLRTGGELPAANQRKIAEKEPLRDPKPAAEVDEEKKPPAPQSKEKPEAKPPEKRKAPKRKSESARGIAAGQENAAPREKPKKNRRKKGPPPPPTFVKGARGRAK